MQAKLIQANVLNALLTAILLVTGVSQVNALPMVAGDVEIIGAPASVVNGALESDTLVRVFQEAVGISLAAGVTADITAAGTVAAAADLSVGLIGAGTRVNSYLFHAEPVGNPTAAFSYSGSATFAKQILGIIVTNGGLDATDAILGAALTTYPIGEVFRGFEGPGFTTQGIGIDDMITLSADLRTIRFTLGTTTQSDQFRVITVPEPATLALVGLSLLGVARVRRRGLPA